MGVIIYSFNLNIPPKRSYGVLECDIVMLQNYVLMIFVIKKQCYLCQTLYLELMVHMWHHIVLALIKREWYEICKIKIQTH